MKYATLWILVLLLAGAGYGSFVAWRWMTPREPLAAPVAVAAPRAFLQQSPPSGPVADFVLTDQDNRPFDSRSLRGKVWVASFFFTNCPAVCWRMNQALAAYQHTHPESAAHFVSITCDPANDTPEALARYAAHFHADPKRWTFLTGDMKTIQSIGQDSFKISVVEKDHTDRACVVDRNGQVRGRFRLTEPDQVVLLEKLLAVVEAEPADETAPPTGGTEKSPAEVQSDAPAATTAAASSGEN